jgi:hypothetical protein
MARTRAHWCRGNTHSHLTVVIPWREAKRREPGIHPTAIIAAQWIPGLRQEAHPGMTTEKRAPTGASRNDEGGASGASRNDDGERLAPE